MPPEEHRNPGDAVGVRRVQNFRLSRLDKAPINDAWQGKTALLSTGQPPVRIDPARVAQGDARPVDLQVGEKGERKHEDFWT